MAWGCSERLRGLINLAWTWLTGAEPIVNVYSYAGVVWHIWYSTPFLFPLMAGVEVDGSFARGGELVSPARRGRCFAVRHGSMLPVRRAFILSFIRGVESFESALVFGTFFF
jgi:iron(III) transport system permease protein